LYGHAFSEKSTHRVLTYVVPIAPDTVDSYGIEKRGRGA
jgi:hypothetical protein